MPTNIFESKTIQPKTRYVDNISVIKEQFDGVVKSGIGFNFGLSNSYTWINNSCTCGNSMCVDPNLEDVSNFDKSDNVSYDETKDTFTINTIDGGLEYFTTTLPNELLENKTYIAEVTIVAKSGDEDGGLQLCADVGNPINSTNDIVPWEVGEHFIQFDMLSDEINIGIKRHYQHGNNYTTEVSYFDVKELLSIEGQQLLYYNLGTKSWSTIDVAQGYTKFDTQFCCDVVVLDIVITQDDLNYLNSNPDTIRDIWTNRKTHTISFDKSNILSYLPFIENSDKYIVELVSNTNSTINNYQDNWIDKLNYGPTNVLYDLLNDSYVTQGEIKSIGELDTKFKLYKSEGWCVEEILEDNRRHAYTSAGEIYLDDSKVGNSG